VRVAGVRLTHPDRVLYPDGALTKVDLARYYERVGPRMLPHLVDRPLSLLRCPDGAAAACFFAKHPGLWTPRELRRIAVPERKKTSSFMVLDDLPGLVMMAQMNVLEVHTWGSRAERLEEPDQMVLDLDPGPAVKWPDVVAAALRVREALARLDLESFVKTTGGKGLHVMVPLQPAAGWDEVLAFTRAIAEAMARAEPRRYTTSLAKAGREDKILVDYLRNGRSATAVAVFSTRARPGAPVSVPVAWEELGGCRPDGFRLADANRWLDRPGDPWAGYFRVKQRLTASRLKTAVEAALPVTAAGREVRARTPR
jgi:bifunctional non-homologous end joining protein LigD